MTQQLLSEVSCTPSHIPQGEPVESQLLPSLELLHCSEGRLQVELAIFPYVKSNESHTWNQPSIDSTIVEIQQNITTITPAGRLPQYCQ